MRDQAVETTATKYPVEAVCRAMRVSRSGFYAWQHRRPRHEMPWAVELAAKVEAVFWRHSRPFQVHAASWRNLRPKALRSDADRCDV